MTEGDSLALRGAVPVATAEHPVRKGSVPAVRNVTGALREPRSPLAPLATTSAAGLQVPRGQPVASSLEPSAPASMKPDRARHARRPSALERGLPDRARATDGGAHERSVLPDPWPASAVQSCSLSPEDYSGGANERTRACRHLHPVSPSDMGPRGGLA